MAEETKNATPKPAARKIPVKSRTRTETVPRLAPGIEIPAGYVAAYYRKRHGLLTLRGPERKDYLVFSIKTGERIPVRSSREASKIMAAIARGLKSFSTAG